MNMYQPQIEEEKEKDKKKIKILAIALVMLFIMSMAIIFYIAYLNKKMLKIYVDGKKVSVASETVIINDDNTVYVSIKDIANKIYYSAQNGEYKEKYVEDTTKCHLTNNYEAVSYIKDSNEIYKTIMGNGQIEEEHEYFTIDTPVIMQKNKLYTTLEGLSQGCNLAASYNVENNTVEIYTLDYLISHYSAQIPDSKEVFEKDDDVNTYKNKKAILYSMMVVKNANGKYGVNTLNNTAIIGEKYKSITFMEQLQEFVIETEDGKFGIIDKEGNTKINPEYASIKQIEKDKGLYLVSKKSNETSGRTQYGIINKKQKVVVYLEYEQIGINKSDFLSQEKEIENQYVLYGKCIPVKKSNKWGLLDINGNTILPLEYDDLGCKSNTSKNSAADSVLLIPEYEAVVVCQDRMYGLFNTSGKELIPTLTTDIYTITSSGEAKYYLTYQGNTLDVIKYLKDTLGIEPVSGSFEIEDDNDTDYITSPTNGNKTQNTVENVTEENTTANNELANNDDNENTVNTENTSNTQTKNNVTNIKNETTQDDNTIEVNI